ncbi:MAG: flagellar basal body rod modification protein, partial [Bacteroidetes bacterium]|nr:flagellar basal body rod modification protein [Bacteroidota bacterium]
MKRRTVLLLAGVMMAIGAAGVWLLPSQESEMPQAPRPPKIRSSAGSNDDPYGRARHEWLRLHDPATGEIPAGIRDRELAFAASLPTRENAQGVSNAAINWSRRGPYNVGGRTRAMAYDLSNTSVILAGGVSG